MFRYNKKLIVKKLLRYQKNVINPGSDTMSPKENCDKKNQNYLDVI